MPAKELSPIEIYQKLPRTNCKECGEANCMAFAAKLVNREALLEECSPLLSPKHKEKFDELWNLLKPAVKAIEVGIGENKITLGGEYVLYRHEFTYFHEPAIAVHVSDGMNEEEFELRVNILNDFSYEYIGMELTLDMLAITCTSDDPDKFVQSVKKASELTTKPLILCNHDPSAMRKALEEVADRRPLIHGATTTNWKDMADLSLEFDCPIVAYAPQDRDSLKSIIHTLEEYGINDLVMDIGTEPNAYQSANVENFTVLRWQSINEEEEHLGYPLLSAPMAAWATEAEDPLINEWNEAALAALCITRFADALIVHGISGWSLLPQVILRSNIYTDPRKPVSVEPGLETLGNPDEISPVLLTTNFALTYYTVASDIESAKLDCYLLVVDSEGMSVESAVAGRKMTADTVAEAIANYKVGDKVTHRHIVIPGRAARLSGEIRELTGWSVSVGPMDSSGISKYIVEKWVPNPEE
ncbi:acetyl-CoA decarbonylase/synthase complex subunit gamma [Candidatus Bathyarchaeota archaeon]|nr:acetyl-CoA decarbonylase/synthase complex subunit gamma [Candidatus Bathyarchaeota archaeon]